MPETIGKYEILERLGAGAMGTVYRARDPALDRLVALKTISPRLLSDPEASQRFQREARAAARLQHPNIVTIFELGEVGGAPYIAMELLEGLDLAEAMADAKRLAVDQKLRVALDLCSGLDYAHKRGVIHRDVKPANVRLLPTGAVKIVDFGIAHVTDSSMTQSGIVLGTPSYIAPEVLAGGRVDHRADMWAVGVVLYELLSGRRPFAGPTFASLAYNVIHAPLPTLDVAALGISPTVLHVASRALAKNPADRFTDMADMGAALHAVLGIDTTSRILTPEARHRACLRHMELAQRLIARGDLEEALVAARRARAMEPSQDDVLALIERVETLLRQGATLAGAVGETLLVPRAPAAGPPAPAMASPSSPLTRVVPAPAAVPAAAPPPVAVKARGPAAFRELATFGEAPGIQTSAVSPVADLLALAGADGGIRLWDLAARVRTAVFRTDMHRRAGHDARGLCLAFSPDGALLASGHVDGSVHLWDVARGTAIPVRLRHEGMASAVAFSPDGALLASGGLDANLKLWDVSAARSGEARRELYRQPAGVTAAAWVGHGTNVLTGHVSRVLRMTDVRTGRLTASLRGPEAQVGVIVLAPDGRRVAVASHDRTVRLFDTTTRTALGSFVAGQRRPVVSLGFLDGGAVIATVSLENVVQLWDAETGSSLGSVSGPADEALAGVALWGGGRRLVAALSDGRLRLWTLTEP